MKKVNKQKNISGFTLIELMVATSIFVVIMLSSMSALYILLDASKNSRALRSAMDNVNFSMESMTRSIRMGTSYVCDSTFTMPSDTSVTHDCSTGHPYLSFIPQNSAVRAGYVRTLRTDGSGTYDIERCTPDTSSCVSIVSSDVDINSLTFFVNGSADNDGVQASVYIMMKGTVTVKGVANSFSLQTIASQRNF